MVLDEKTVILLGQLCEMGDRMLPGHRIDHYLHFTREGVALIKWVQHVEKRYLEGYWQFSDSGWQPNFRQHLRYLIARFTNPDLPR